MTIETLYEGDTVDIVSDTDFDDLGNASLIEFLVTKPSAEVVKWTASRVGITQDITYTTAASDLDEIGIYKIQAHVEWDGGNSELHGEIKRFKVLAHLSEVATP
jgi:hypothetical protein